MMKIALVNSALDPAGINIRRHIEALLDRPSEVLPGKDGRTYEFHETEGRLIHADGVDRTIDADLLIFLSRHASVNPILCSRCM